VCVAGDLRCVKVLHSVSDEAVEMASVSVSSLTTDFNSLSMI